MLTIMGRHRTARLLIAASLVLRQGVGIAADNDVLDHIRAAWSHRYKAIRTVTCKWTTKCRIQKLVYFVYDGHSNADALSDDVRSKYEREYLDYSEVASFSASGMLMR
jgi:hypothetical protein